MNNFSSFFTTRLHKPLPVWGTGYRPWLYRPKYRLYYITKVKKTAKTFTFAIGPLNVLCSKMDSELTNGTRATLFHKFIFDSL